MSDDAGERAARIRERVASNYRVYPGKAQPIQDVRALLAEREALLARCAAAEAALAVYANPDNWTGIAAGEQYTGTWYAGHERNMADVFLPPGDGWETAGRAIAATRPGAGDPQEAR